MALWNGRKLNNNITPKRVNCILYRGIYIWFLFIILYSLLFVAPSLSFIFLWYWIIWMIRLLVNDDERSILICMQKNSKNYCSTYIVISIKGRQAMKIAIRLQRMPLQYNAPFFFFFFIRTTRTLTAKRKLIVVILGKWT